MRLRPLRNRPSRISREVASYFGSLRSDPFRFLSGPFSAHILPLVARSLRCFSSVSHVRFRLIKTHTQHLSETVILLPPLDLPGVPLDHRSVVGCHMEVTNLTSDDKTIDKGSTIDRL